MALNWRREMTRNDAYRGTGGGSRRVPTYGGDQGRGGQGNVRRFTAPQRGGSFSDAATGRRHGSPRATDFKVSSNWGPKIKDFASGIANTGKNVGMGLMGPAMAGVRHIGQNLDDHRYLDTIYGPRKSQAFFDQAGRNFYGRGLYAPGADPSKDEPLTDITGMSFGDIEENRAGTLSGTSLGQAMKYFEKAGITQQELNKFNDPDSKWFQNQAYLESAAGAEGAEDFREGMTYIKNAKATSALRRATENARNQLAEEGLPFRSGIEQEGGPSRSYPVDTGTAFEDFRSGIEQEGGSPYSYDMTEEDITADIGGSPYGLDALNLMPSYTPSLGGSFSDFATGKGQPQITRRKTGKGRWGGPGQYTSDIMRTYPGDPNAGEFTDNFPTGYEKYFGGMEPRDTRNIQTSQTGTRAGPGSFDNFYMNTIGDIVNRGSNLNPLPDISVEFGEWEEDENLNPRLPAWKR